MTTKLYQDPKQSVNARVEDLLQRMTLAEKVAQLGSLGPERLVDKSGAFISDSAEKALANGIGQITRVAGASGLEPQQAAKAHNSIQRYLVEHTRLGIPALFHEECLSGLMAKGGTAYPQAIGLACTWNPELIQTMTNEIRRQMVAIGARLGLSPVLDLIRDLRWGRVEETFGEDHYLAAAMGSAYIKGLQGDDLKQGVYGTLKHFAGHSFSEGGRNHAPVHIGPRNFRETFLYPYAAVIKEAQASVVMSCYHDLDGIPGAASKQLLTDILRGELGFEGIVVADYNNIKMLHTEHRVAESKQEAGIMALEAGLDIELPKTDCYGDNLVAAVNSGLIDISVVDRAVSRHLKLKFELGLFENCYVAEQHVADVFETKQQRALARDLARESMVLLKNENSLLPLQKSKLKSIAVIGPSAASTRNVLGDYVYSAHVDSPEDAVPVVSILDGIKAQVGSEITVNYAQGCGIMDRSTDGIPAAVAAAKASDVAIVVVGGRSGLSGLIAPGDISDVDFTSQGLVKDTDGESHDRTTLNLTGVQEQLVQAIHATNTPTIVVLINGRPLCTNWISDHVPAIVEAWLPGEETGNAVADVLFGEYNPSGKLCVSIPKNVGQIPVHYNRTMISYTRRYIDADNLPLYPFGYGLSYTDFAYRNLVVTQEEDATGTKIIVELEVGNAGLMAGTEVVQLYFRDLYASRTRPVKQLSGFAKVALEPQEFKRLRFTMNADQLAFYDNDMRLVVEPGTFEIMVGSSSQDIRLKTEFELTNEQFTTEQDRSYFSEVQILS